MPIKNYSTTASSNNSAPPNGFPEGMAPASLNDGMRQVMADIRAWYEDPAWIDFGFTPTYVSGTSFTVSGDKTAAFVVGRRIRAIGTTPFTIYGTIATSSFSSPNTTVTVTWDSGSMDATLSAVALNLVQDSIDDLRLTDIIAAGSSGVVLKNSSGTTVATIGASAGTVSNFSGNLNVTGALGANGVLNINGTSSSAGYATFAEDTDNGTNKVTLIAPASLSGDVTVTLPSTAGTLSVATITEWVAYTPTLTGLGTATGVEFYSRRVGDTLEVRGKFTCGTTTATEARIELGFNGTSGSITSADSTKLPSGTSLCGTGAISVASAVLIHTLIERSVTYLTFGIQTVSNAGLTKANGTVFSSGQTVSVFASVPITGW